MKILVTGCAGYIGSCLVPHLLAKGHEVIGVDSLRYGPAGLVPSLAHDGFTFHKVDVRGDEWLKLARTVDVVYPLAALVGAPLCKDKPNLAPEINARAIERLVRVLSPHQKLVIPSSNSGYRNSNRPLTEEDPLWPQSLYGRTKVDGEFAALAHEGAVSFRLATVFGVSPRMRTDLLVNDFVLSAFRIREGKKKTLTLYEGHYSRNYVGVQDVCRALIFAVENDLKGAYNLGNPEVNMTKMDLAKNVFDAVGVPHEKIEEGEGRDEDQRNYIVSNEKVLRAGFTFTQGLMQAIPKLVQFYENHTFTEIAMMRNK